MCKSYSYTRSSSLFQAQRSEFSAIPKAFDPLEFHVRQQGVSPEWHRYTGSCSLPFTLSSPLPSPTQPETRWVESSASLAFSKIRTCTCSFVGFYVMVCMFGVAGKVTCKSRGGGQRQLSFCSQEFGGKLFCTHSTLVCLLSSGTWQRDADADTANDVLVAPSSAASPVCPSSEITFATGQKRMPNIPSTQKLTHSTDQHDLQSRSPICTETKEYITTSSTRATQWEVSGRTVLY